MKRTKILGALLAGVMAVSGISVIPGVSSPFVVEAEAASKLAAPTGLKATVSGTTVKLTWNAVKGADAYRVYICDNRSGKFKTYKTVSGTKCEVTKLTEGTGYRFKVAALTKNGSKYSVQTKSSHIAVMTAGASVSGSEKKPGEFSDPIFGDSSKKVLKYCGIGYYTSEKAPPIGVTYTGKVDYAGIESTMHLTFNENDQLCSYALEIPMTKKDYDSFLEYFKSGMDEAAKDILKGTEYTVMETTSGQPVNVWTNGNGYISIEYSPDLKCLCLMEIDFTYVPEDLKIN